jgi:hypothetical protein
MIKLWKGSGNLAGSNMPALQGSKLTKTVVRFDGAKGIEPIKL